MKQFLLLTLIYAAGCLLPAKAQTKHPLIKGKLFIIGGGGRGVQLMKTLVAAVAFGLKDYAVVLPMSGKNPDTSFYYFKEDL